MKKLPRAEISTIKQMLYPEKKKSQKEWNKKHLKSLKDLEEKNKKIKEEKKNFISPEPYKIEKFKNIPSKLKTDTVNWINREQNSHKILPKTPNIGQRKNNNNNRTKINNTLNPIVKPYTSNNEEKRIIGKNNEVEGEENIYNILNNKTVTMFDKYYANKKKEKNNNNIIYNQNYNTDNVNSINNINTNQMNNELYTYQDNSGNYLQKNDIQEGFNRNEAVEKLIKEYKEKYGTDEALEKMINEYYGNNTNTNTEKTNTIEKSNLNMKTNINNNNNNKKVFLPKIQKNYIRENRQLIIDNKIPIKRKQSEEPLIKPKKHKDYGKIPSYIKKYELEREVKKEEIKRKEEALKYPKGTKLLSEEERLSTLNGLIQNKKDLTNQLEKMPITTRTNAVRIRKEEIIKKLDELEKAIDMFSKKQVFVKI